jgi:hypothetical protein
MYTSHNERVRAQQLPNNQGCPRSYLVWWCTSVASTVHGTWSDEPMQHTISSKRTWSDNRLASWVQLCGFASLLLYSANLGKRIPSHIKNSASDLDTETFYNVWRSQLILFSKSRRLCSSFTHYFWYNAMDYVARKKGLRMGELQYACLMSLYRVFQKSLAHLFLRYFHCPWEHRKNICALLKRKESEFLKCQA